MAEKDIKLRYEALDIREDDLREIFTRARGNGGQNVNKVSTCVILTHVPTGTRVRCEEARGQAANRELARIRLIEKLEDAETKSREMRKQVVEKKKRSKRRPSKAAKKRNVESKRRHGDVKKLRGKVQND